MRIYFSVTIFLIAWLALWPGTARADGPETGRDRKLSLQSDIGDVLRPDRNTGTHWFIGLDGGLTYSSFIDGPLVYYVPNTHNPRYPLALASLNDGNGIGLYFGATLDFPLSKVFGLVFKGNYHSRVGESHHIFDTREVDPNTNTSLSTVLDNNTTLTFNYIGFDVLGRINLGASPVYFLFGPSFGYLSSTTADLHQRIIQPDDLYYIEDINGSDLVLNNYRDLSSKADIHGFSNTRIDAKFGFGAWIKLDNNLFLTPEISVAYPISTIISETDDLTELYVRPPAALVTELVNQRGVNVISSNRNFNLLTAFFTIGLRWRIN